MTPLSARCCLGRNYSPHCRHSSHSLTITGSEFTSPHGFWPLPLAAVPSTAQDLPALRPLPAGHRALSDTEGRDKGMLCHSTWQKFPCASRGFWDRLVLPSPGTRAQLSMAWGTAPGCRSAGSQGEPCCRTWLGRSGWCRLEEAGCSALCGAGSQNSHMFWCSVPTHLLPSWEGKESQTPSTVNLFVLLWLPHPLSKLIYMERLPSHGRGLE